MTQKELINKIISQLTPEDRQAFFDELGRLMLKRIGEEQAISEAFKKIGIDNPLASLKVTLKNEVLFGVPKKRMKKVS